MNGILDTIINIHNTTENISNLLDKLFNLKKLNLNFIPNFPKNYKLRNVRCDWSQESIYPSALCYFFDLMMENNKGDYYEYTFEYNVLKLKCEIVRIVDFLEEHIKYNRKKEITFELENLTESINDVKEFLNSYLGTKIE